MMYIGLELQYFYFLLAEVGLRNENRNVNRIHIVRYYFIYLSIVCFVTLQKLQISVSRTRYCLLIWLETYSTHIFPFLIFHSSYLAFTSNLYKTLPPSTVPPPTCVLAVFSFSSLLLKSPKLVPCTPLIVICF